MGKVKIVDIRPRTRFISPERSVTTLDVTYETEKGFRGTVKDLPEKATEDEIWAAVAKAGKTPDKLMGMEKEL